MRGRVLRPTHRGREIAAEALVDGENRHIADLLPVFEPDEVDCIE